MSMFRITAAIILAYIFSQAAYAQGDAVMVQNKFKQFFSNTAVKVKEAAAPAEKRAILNESFKKMQSTLDRISEIPDVSEDDLAAINSVKESIQEKHNELNGLDGYDKIKDNQLDNFADYVRQDMEQAEQWVTISVTTLLLVAILLILLVR